MQSVVQAWLMAWHGLAAVAVARVTEGQRVGRQGSPEGVDAA